VATLAGALLAGASACVPPPTSTRGSLAVTISGLPDGLAASVDIDGPRGFHQHLTAATTLRKLVPGSYTTTVSEVDADGVRHLGGADASATTVRVGKTATVAVSYPTGVSERTRFLTAEDLAEAVVSPDQTTITFPASSALVLAVGDILASGPTVELPGGLLRTVTAIDQSAATVTVTTIDADLTDAIPQATLHESGDISAAPPAATGSAVRSGSATASDIGVGGDVLASVGTKNVACGAGGGIAVSPHLSNVTFHHDISPSWNALTGVRIEASVSAGATWGATVESTGAAACSATLPLVPDYPVGTPFLMPIPFTPIVLPVVPEMSVALSVGGSVDRGVSFTTSHRREFSAHMLYAFGAVDASAGQTGSSDSEDLPETVAKGALSWTITPKLTFKVLDVGGPSFGIGAGQLAEFNPVTDGPIWQVKNTLAGTVGISGGIPHLIEAGVEAPIVTYSQLVRASAPQVDDSTPLPSARAGVPYAQQLKAIGGPNGPCTEGASCEYHWSIDATASTPPWLTITDDGVLHVDAPAGTPAAPVIPFTVNVRDDATFSDDHVSPIPISTGSTDLTIALEAGPTSVITIDPPTVPPIVRYVDAPTIQLTTHPNGIQAWQASGLPEGMSISFFGGQISGRPTESGDFDVHVEVQSSDGGYGTLSFTLTVQDDACSAVCLIPLVSGRVFASWNDCHCGISPDGPKAYVTKDYVDGAWVGGGDGSSAYIIYTSLDVWKLPDGRLWTIIGEPSWAGHILELDVGIESGDPGADLSVLPYVRSNAVIVQ
jgi:hypothetical protein